MNIYLVVIFVVLLLAINAYFKLADRFNIIDKPNERSSHKNITIRGGGVIFPISIILYSLIHSFDLIYLTAAVVVAALVSFWDDVKTIGSGVRLLFQIMAVTLLFYELGLYVEAVWLIPILFVFALANINAFNFMDGINGISVLHYISIALSCIYINEYIEPNYISMDFILYALLGFIVFAIYNLRTKAKCFAGDVGSVAAAFICMYMVYQLVYVSGDFKYILLMLVFGLDSLMTIAVRLSRKENIMKPHRKHLYQYMANEAGMSHVKVAVIYFAIQLGFDVLIVSFSFMNVVVFTLLIAIIYILIRSLVFKKYVLPYHKA